MKKTLPLTLDLVPSTSWFNNVRAVLTKKQWDTVRFKVFAKAYDTCEICGGIGPKHPVECHEIWEYDDSELIQKLVGMISLCPDCHMVKHMGLAQIKGNGEKAMKHFMKVNKVKRAEADKFVFDAFVQWAKRSKRKWTLDISLLKDYGINVQKIEENKKA
jgi:hypothetical protein